MYVLLLHYKCSILNCFRYKIVHFLHFNYKISPLSLYSERLRYIHYIHPFINDSCANTNTPTPVNPAPSLILISNPPLICHLGTEGFEIFEFMRRIPHHPHGHTNNYYSYEVENSCHKSYFSNPWRKPLIF